MDSVAKDMKNVVEKVVDTISGDISITEIPEVNKRVIQENTYLTKNYSNTIESIRQASELILQLDGKELGRIIVPLYDKEKNRVGVALG